MLLEYTCENFRSIKEKVVFSFLASSDNTFIEKTRCFAGEDFNVLRMSALYGANGSGKSSLIQSMLFLKTFVANSINHQTNDAILRVPHKACDESIPTSFSCQFIKNGVRYAYGVSYTNTTVTEEYLYHFKNGRKAKIFERKELLDSLSIGKGYLRDSETAKSVLKKNRLFLSCAANFSSNADYEAAFLFFKDDIVVYPTLSSEWLNYSIERLSNDAELKSKFLEIMNHFGTGLKDVKVKLEKRKIDKNELPHDMPDQLKSLIASQESNIIEANIDYGLFSIDLTEDSSGVRKLVEVLCPLLEVLSNDKVLIWDELEASLHPCIVYDILDLFDNRYPNSNAQLLFSTHDINLLDLNRFRRDQIWFTEMNPKYRYTDLYSLAELKRVRKDENIRKGYINGKYGAVPCLNSEISDLFDLR